jgi:hypothetical protein
MRRLLFKALMVVPAIALLVGVLVWFDAIPVGMESRRTFFLVWALGTLGCWVLTVVMAAGMVKGRAWLFCPRGMLAVSGTVATGVAGFFLGSVALFVILLALTMTASLLAMREARSGTPDHRAFSWGFAACNLMGVAFTLMARHPVTGTPIVTIMWWDATEWGNGLSWNGASYLGIEGLLLTWFFGFTGGWLLRQFVAAKERWASKAGRA